MLFYFFSPCIIELGIQSEVDGTPSKNAFWKHFLGQILHQKAYQSNNKSKIKCFEQNNPVS